MASVACVMKYIEYIQGIYIAEKTLKVVLSPSTRKLLMDQATISALELVQGTRGRSDSQLLSHGKPLCCKSLCKMLNNTQTMAGNRLLRSTVRKTLRVVLHYWHLTEKRLLFSDAAANMPSENDVLHSSVCSSQARHEVVGIFLDNPAWFFDVMEALRDFVDLDRLLGQLVFVPKVITPRVSRIAIGSVIALKHTLECLPKLVSCLETTSVKLDCPCPLLDSIIQRYTCAR
ncbi:hypothetical protein KXD40_001295 [Peronospora effusa]|nr:hypothetical protein KXD40_001295 [Peronospora effusa]